MYFVRRFGCLTIRQKSLENSDPTTTLTDVCSIKVFWGPLKFSAVTLFLFPFHLDFIFFSFISHRSQDTFHERSCINLKMKQGNVQTTLKNISALHCHTDTILVDKRVRYSVRKIFQFWLTKKNSVWWKMFF